MDEAAEAALRELTDRVAREAGADAAYGPVLEAVRGGSAADHEALARVLTEPACVLGVREVAAFVLGCAGDRRAFEVLVLLLNHRDPARCSTAAFALARLGDPRTGRAAAALATNPLRTAYALHPVRLLVRLRAPEAVPALTATLERLVDPGEPHWRVGLACVEGLGELGDGRAVTVLTSALGHPRLSAAAEAALAGLALRG